MSVIRFPHLRVLDGLSGRFGPLASRTIDQALFLRLAALQSASTELSGLDPVDPAAFWAASRVHDPEVVRVYRDAHSRRGGRVRTLDLEADSHGPGTHPGARRLYARACVQRNPSPNAPLVVILHGFAVPAPHFEDWHARRLVARGAHVARLDLPYHMRRRIPGRVSGDGFFAYDLEHERAVIRQAVEDAAALVRWAQQEITPNVAVMGFSLGGLISALLASNVALGAALPVIPACELPRVFVEYAPRRARRRLKLYAGSAAPWGDDATEALHVLDGALAPLVPRNLTPVTERERILLVAADHDRIVGGPPVRRLAEAWGVECWDYPFGHITVSLAPGLTARMHGWLMSTAGRGRAVPVVANGAHGDAQPVDPATPAGVDPGSAEATGAGGDAKPGRKRRRPAASAMG